MPDTRENETSSIINNLNSEFGDWWYTEQLKQYSSNIWLDINSQSLLIKKPILIYRELKPSCDELSTIQNSLHFAFENKNLDQQTINNFMVTLQRDNTPKIFEQLALWIFSMQDKLKYEVAERHDVRTAKAKFDSSWEKKLLKTTKNWLPLLLAGVGAYSFIKSFTSPQESSFRLFVGVVLMCPVSCILFSLLACAYNTRQKSYENAAEQITLGAEDSALFPYVDIFKTAYDVLTNNGENTIDTSFFDKHFRTDRDISLRAINDILHPPKKRINPTLSNNSLSNFAGNNSNHSDLLIEENCPMHKKNDIEAGNANKGTYHAPTPI